MFRYLCKLMGKIYGYNEHHWKNIIFSYHLFLQSINIFLSKIIHKYNITIYYLTITLRIVK